MMQAPIDMRRLLCWAANRGLGRRPDDDMGYLLHVLLAGTFGPKAIRPFRLIWSPRRSAATLYGYSLADAAGLREEAEAVGTPESLQVIEPGSIVSKAMPEALRQGRRIGFETRVRPVVRSSIARDGRTRAREVDIHVWRGRRQRPDEPVTAERAYGEWLQRRVNGAAHIEVARIAHLRENRAWRGERGCSAGRDVTLQGRLVVGDPEKFQALLANGVGRHKAYGYGMLLPRPA